MFLWCTNKAHYVLGSSSSEWKYIESFGSFGQLKAEFCRDHEIRRQSIYEFKLHMYNNTVVWVWCVPSSRILSYSLQLMIMITLTPRIIIQKTTQLTKTIKNRATFIESVQLNTEQHKFHNSNKIIIIIVFTRTMSICLH